MAAPSAPSTSEPGCPDLKLFMFRGSNAVRTAELMLAHKAIAYEEVLLKRGEHITQLPARGFQGITLPAIEAAGQRVQGTREISQWLDELKPEPKLFPANDEERLAVKRAEQYGEQLQDVVRRLFYCATNRTAPTAVEQLAAAHHGATDAAAKHDLATLNARLDRIDDWIQIGLLNGSELNAADFQIAPNIAWLLRFEDIAPSIVDRPAAAHATRVAGEAPRQLQRVFPDEWLQPLRGAVRRHDRRVTSRVDPMLDEAPNQPPTCS